jgi:hypothetical protein
MKAAIVSIAFMALVAFVFYVHKQFKLKEKENERRDAIDRSNGPDRLRNS